MEERGTEAPQEGNSQDHRRSREEGVEGQVVRKQKSEEDIEMPGQQKEGEAGRPQRIGLC